MDLGKCMASALAIGVVSLSGCIVSTPTTPSNNSITWSTSLAGGSDPVGAQLAFFCPPNGTPSTVWGTDIYSDDSSVCTAAVHAGIITFNGGMIRVQVQPGQAQYVASERNGVSTSDYGSWGRSFSFVP